MSFEWKKVRGADDDAVLAAGEADVPAGATLNLEFKDDHEARHRREAVRNHLSRAQQHLLNMALITLIIAGAPIYWRIVYSELGLSFGDAWPLSAIEAGGQKLLGVIDSSTGVVAHSLMLALTLVPPLWSIVFLWLYRRERDRDWRVAEAQAGERDPTAGARGYMKVFRLYARTKRRGIFTLFYGAAGLWWGAVGVLCLTMAGGKLESAMAFVYLGAAVAAVLGWLVVVYLGYDIGRRFVPGNILVTKTLILSVLATTSQTNYTDAREAARELEAEIVEEKPWWFYSYKKKPKRYV